MKRVLKKIFGIYFLLAAFGGIFALFSNSKENRLFLIFIDVLLFVLAFLLLKKPKVKQNDKNTPTMYVQNEKGIISQIDNKPITDEEMPHLIEFSKQQALQKMQQSSNPIFRRTEKEKKLCRSFIKRHIHEIGFHTNSFSNYYRRSTAINNLNEKIYYGI